MKTHEGIELWTALTNKGINHGPFPCIAISPGMIREPNHGLVIAQRYSKGLDVVWADKTGQKTQEALITARPAPGYVVISERWLGKCRDALEDVSTAIRDDEIDTISTDICDAAGQASEVLRDLEAILGGES